MDFDPVLEGKAIVAKVDALVALKEPKPDDVGKILGAPLVMGQRSEKFNATMSEGALRQAYLRYYKDVGAGILVLDARLEPGLVQKHLDLAKYGPLPPPTANPGVQPEGVASYKVVPAQGITVSFQFTSQTKRLYVVTVDWAKLSERSS